VGEPRFPATEVAAALGCAVSLLGAGAYGDTWRVGDYAVKIICADGYQPERIAREVNGLTRVQSPHVVRLLATRTVMLGDRERPALIFEFIDGGDLSEKIRCRKWPTVTEAVALLWGLLIAVDDMHGAGVNHRDIKPANIALRGGDWSGPVLLDLGLARSAGESTITVYPAVVGTRRYMAPEQLQGLPARKAADLFAVGVTVRELLSRRHPFYDDGVDYSPAQAVARIAEGPHPLPVGVPRTVADLLDRLTAPAEHMRGSAQSSLRRLRQRGDRSA
jgi:serine/threonine-protein kinase